MAEDIKNTNIEENEEPLMMQEDSETAEPAETGRTANKAPSFREATYKPADPNKPGPKTIFLNADPDLDEEEDELQEELPKDEPQEDEPQEKALSRKKASSGEKPSKKKKPQAKETSFISRFRKKLNQATGKEAPKTGSTVKKKQAQKAARNDLLKKGIIGLIALIIVVLLIILIVNNSQVKNVGEITIDSTSTTQTLIWSGARKGLTYEVYRAEGNNGQYMLIDTLTGGENQKTYDNLTSGTLYKYNIITVKGNGTKTDGTAAQAYTVPSSVTGITAATTSDVEGSLTVQWNLQGSTSDYELKYDLYDNLRDATTVSFSADQATAGSADGTYSYTLTNLIPEETYYLSMRTVCADKVSEWSEVASGTVGKPVVKIGDVDVDKPMVALTFDGGPDGDGVTDRILTVLSDNQGKATFFQTGVNAAAYPDLMKRMVEEGHEIGNHTYDESTSGEDVTENDIVAANDAIEAACGVRPVLFRAPQGDVTDNIIEICQQEGMSIIIFNFDSHDWEYYDAEEIIDRIETYVEDGDIIQFRNVYEETASAIETLVPYLIEEGYQLVTVSEMIQARTGELPAVGTIYYSGSDHE